MVLISKSLVIIKANPPGVSWSLRPDQETKTREKPRSRSQIGGEGEHLSESMYYRTAKRGRSTNH